MISLPIVALALIGGADMSILPVYKICARCKKQYSWNPSLGKMMCPNCGLIKVAESEGKKEGKKGGNKAKEDKIAKDSGIIKLQFKLRERRLKRKGERGSDV